MSKYSKVHFSQSVYDPSRQVTSEKKELVIATSELELSRDGLVLQIKHLPSGRSVEVPWSAVRYAVVAPSVPQKK